MKMKIMPIWTILGTVGGVSIIRSFLEYFSNPEPLYTFSPWFVSLNYFLCFISLIVGIGYIISRFLNESPTKWVLIIAKYSPIIFIAPLIDLVLSRGAGICMGYLGSGGWLMAYDFFTFFGKMTNCGISPGMRIEIAIILIAVIRIFWIKTRSIQTVVVGAFSVYAFIFATGAIAGILGLFAGGELNAGSWLSESLAQSLIGTAHGYLTTQNSYWSLHAVSIIMARVHLITTLLIGFLIILKEYPHHISSWIKNSRWERIIYYLLLMFSGAYLAWKLFPVSLNWIDEVGIIIGIIALVTTCWAGAVWNDVNDTTIDAISNPDRPLQSQNMSHAAYKTYGIIFFIIGTTAALLISYPFFICILLFNILYGLYSFKETLWKRNFITSGLVIASVGCIIFIGGFIFIQTNQSLLGLTYPVLLTLFGTIAIIAQAKDFKDVPGDAAAGIKTLPVVLGKRRASLIISIILIFWIVILAFLWSNILIILQVVPWIVIDVILRKRISERLRFIILFGQIITLIMFYL